MGGGGEWNGKIYETKKKIIRGSKNVKFITKYNQKSTQRAKHFEKQQKRKKETLVTCLISKDISFN